MMRTPPVCPPSKGSFIIDLHVEGCVDLAPPPSIRRLIVDASGDAGWVKEGGRWVSWCVCGASYRIVQCCDSDLRVWGIH